MLSHKVVQIIEGQTGAIVNLVVEKIRSNPELEHFQKLPDQELRDWGIRTLKDLGNWLIAAKDQALVQRYESLGGLRFRESVPLQEVLCALHMLRRNTIQFVHDEVSCETSVETIPEDVVQDLIEEFFDWLEEHLAHGYEHFLRQAM